MRTWGCNFGNFGKFILIFPEISTNLLFAYVNQLFRSPALTRAHQEMRYPNVTWRIILYDYFLTTELRHTCTSRIFSN